MKQIAISIFLILTCSLSFSQAQSGADFLNIEVGARPIALGGAYTAIADDIYTVSYNPAGIAALLRPEFSLMYLDWIADISFQHLAMCFPLQLGTVAASISYLGMPTLKVRKGGLETGEELSCSDLSITGGYGLNLFKDQSKRLDVGATTLFVNQKQGDKIASGISFGLGALARFNIWYFKHDDHDNFSVGIALNRLGPNIAYGKETAPMPLNFKVGVSYRPIKIVTFAFDYDKTVDTPSIIRIGTEVTAMKMFRPRIGFAGSRNRTEVYGGMGFALTSGKTTFQVDYALNFINQIDLNNWISLTLRFE